MKVKEKAETVANNGCMLTPGMRECKPDVYTALLRDDRRVGERNIKVCAECSA